MHAARHCERAWPLGDGEHWSDRTKFSVVDSARKENMAQGASVGADTPSGMAMLSAWRSSRMCPSYPSQTSGSQRGWARRSTR